MTYFDIFAESIAHFTAIDADFVKQYFFKFLNASEDNAKYLNDIMHKQIPPDYGQNLLEKLKAGEFNDTVKFFGCCLGMYKQEVDRQAVMN